MTRLITIFGNSGVIPTVQGWELRTLLRGSANQNAGNIKTCRRHTIQCIKVTFGALGARSETSPTVQCFSVGKTVCIYFLKASVDFVSLVSRCNTG